jgi:uncharacterized protein (TIGR03435 family)
LPANRADDTEHSGREGLRAPQKSEQCRACIYRAFNYRAFNYRAFNYRAAFSRERARHRAVHSMLSDGWNLLARLLPMNPTNLLRWLLLPALAAIGASLHAQPLPAFEVASIKPNTTGLTGHSISTDAGGRMTAVNVSVKLLMELAFDREDFRIAGGPAWLDAATWDIAATTGKPGELSVSELRPLVQSLLADRFALKFHREIKQASVYSLVAAKGGAKLTPSPESGRTTMNTNLNKASIAIVATKARMEALVYALSVQLGRPVTDNTGLKGEFDFKVVWTPDQVADTSGPSLFTALQEQLGLRLESTKGPEEVIVVDSVQKASDN